MSTHHQDRSKRGVIAERELRGMQQQSARGQPAGPGLHTASGLFSRYQLGSALLSLPCVAVSLFDCSELIDAKSDSTRLCLCVGCCNSERNAP